MGLTNNLGKLSNMITSTGSAVGIGTTSPTALLQIAGAQAGVSGKNLTISYNGTYYAEYTEKSVSAFNNPLSFGAGATGAEMMRISANGNVGIGTSSPTAITGFTSVCVNNATTGGFFEAQQGGTVLSRYGAQNDISFIDTVANIPFIIKTNSSERMRITSGGLVGIGVSPSYMFHVQGNLTQSQSLFYNTLNAGTEANILLRLGSNCNNTNCTYLSGGIFGVADKFYIYGNGNMVNANNSYGPLSDIKLKENITDATPKLDKLMQVRIVNYNLISDPNLKQIGVIAQELEQIFPGLVDQHIDKDEEGNLLETTTKSVKMSVFVPMLIKAMQEQQEIIQDLKSRLDKAGL